jgi:hypothetical protein
VVSSPQRTYHGDPRFFAAGDKVTTYGSLPSKIVFEFVGQCPAYPGNLQLKTPAAEGATISFPAHLVRPAGPATPPARTEADSMAQAVAIQVQIESTKSFHRRDLLNPEDLKILGDLDRDLERPYTTILQLSLVVYQSADRRAITV